MGVSVWTLVVMSVERYYAICHPLKSRESRQTLSHAYRMIAFVWFSSLISMSPIAVLSQLQYISNTGNSFIKFVYILITVWWIHSKRKKNLIKIHMSLSDKNSNYFNPRAKKILSWIQLFKLFFSDITQSKVNFI